MKTWYLVKNFVASLSVSLNSLTVISFDKPIDSYFLGTSKNYVYSALSKDRKSLILKGLKKTKTNLFVATKNDQYSFDVITSLKASGALNIKRARRDSIYRYLRNGKGFRLYEGRHGLLKVTKNGESQLISRLEH